MQKWISIIQFPECSSWIVTLKVTALGIQLPNGGRRKKNNFAFEKERNLLKKIKNLKLKMISRPGLCVYESNRQLNFYVCQYIFLMVKSFW